ncbi:polysaccharide pyruvyl transferase family protein [Chitinispirillales bacterium ANBcel5]|uniref:polysaccharide pyruvyl transferase family protein n=1 Tax=Cellulosispirillum alkaliphilum TaxID=3039283 RepID=UPI002A5193F0|nr:polysaccharide pyruvyl transferase family protein [Chitinispirillales bacterium ANBcel5]
MNTTIGILSMQKVVNYGSFLQAFALKKAIESLGSDVYFLDINQGEYLPGLEIRKNRRLKSFISSLYSGKLQANQRRKQYFSELSTQFRENYFKILELSKDSPSFFDGVIIGSDEVFHACQQSPWGFSTQLFGRGLPSKHIISYAASFGNTTVESILNYGIENTITESLKNLDSISVRDSNSYEIIRYLTEYRPSIHVDPVMFYDFSDYMGEIDTKDYILIYTYPERITPREQENITHFAKINNKKLISIGCSYPWSETVIPDSPFEVLSYFDNADYVITDTFHGTVFSIKYNKNFCTFIRNTNKHKLLFLLQQFDQENRQAESEHDLYRILMNEPDYSKTNELIKSERMRSIDYLSDFTHTIRV